MSKRRSVAYTKPEEPQFLKRLKQQAGYQEGPTVDTKREDWGPAEDAEELDDEKPTVVVLNQGDLTEEEAATEQAKLEKESAETPADLSARIVFKTPSKKSAEKSSSKPKKPDSKKSKPLLSFNDDEEEEEGSD